MWSVLSSSLCALALITKPFFVDDEVELRTAKVKGKVVNFIVAFTMAESSPGETASVPNNQPRLDQTTPPSHPVVAAH